MSVSMPLAEAAAKLSELVAGLRPGDEVALTADGVTVARLVPAVPPLPPPRTPGSAVGLLTVVSEDDDHLADFAEYM